MNEPSSSAGIRPFLAGVGNVCVQWAMLEQTILFVIGTIDDVPIEKAYLTYAGLGMIPRLNMAIQLAQYARLPQRFIKPLQGIRRALQKDGGDLAQKRNLYVHGAHKPGDAEGEVVLVMGRWKGDKREQVVTLADVTQLGNELAMQAHIAVAIFRDYGNWKFGPQGERHGDQNIAKTKAVLRLIRAQQIKRGLKLIFGNLKPV